MKPKMMGATKALKMMYQSTFGSDYSLNVDTD